MGQERGQGGFHLLQGTFLDLAYSFPGNGKRIGDLLQGHRFVGGYATLDDEALLVVQNREGRRHLPFQEGLFLMLG